VALPAVALAMVAIGIAETGEAVSVPLIVVGSGMFFVGMVMPALTEFQIGPTGFSAKLRERDLDFQAALGPETEQLVRTGTWLAGDPMAGRHLAERALVETYMRWPQESGAAAANPTNAVRERMVELAPPAQAEPVAPAQPGEAGGTGDLLSKLVAMPVAERAALVLHLLEGLDTQTVATITGSEPATVAYDVARGAASIVGGAMPPGGATPSGAAW
jgi:hypothetical protein